MTSLYLIRHAQATGNTENRVNGGLTDCDLTNRGYEEILMLSKYAKELNLHKIYTSPLTRAYKTASALNWYIDKPLEIVGDLIEAKAGKWDGMRWDDIENASQLYDLTLNDPNFKENGGEPMDEVMGRMADAIHKIADSNDGNNIAVVSHGAALRTFLCHVKGWEISRYKEQEPFKNTAITKIIYADDKFSIIYENEISHLNK